MMMPRETTILTPVKAKGNRIDLFLAKSRPELGLSRTRIQELIRQGLITIDGKPVKIHQKISGEETVQITIPEIRPLNLLPSDIPFGILYEDADLIVLNKPSGMVVHPAPGNREGTLVNALLYHCKDLSGIGGVERPGIVHRLDKDTSGVMVAVKNDRTHHALAAQIKARKIKKIYAAVVQGEIKKDSDSIVAPIGRHDRFRKKMTVRLIKGREAITFYQVEERFEGYTLVQVRLKTGRTHQIRVHFSHVHHPVAGDPVYGGKHFQKIHHHGREMAVKRQMLHSRLLGFIHPGTGKYMEFEAEIPPDMQEVIGFLRGRA
ncbi:MAG: RNA pseudouridine synthase [Nitrospirae bacterium CG_4_9_14_3_um_filter_53_35]|nr:MAG: hypothetical protein AUK29_04965 [Nitrospirae bacterium CG2_30_53_67]PIS37922.1 MAG: RNA pseudouridine synthase [Nitrospirae bacterium CG08_land_8_20_14_0_20_52_24]PIV85474.1 MAG: RNA pseudouridine synthase [Nitrospirae bacterium CG17_big_fil_post_rev_8_21_14_2_50_50_9]PIW84135.1 MAG: RNA pseudouridine synthase [Nitrospirae bacterium CG_4_8_14_3_um_filter_50_41]PIX85297.1 MAG: RNA pseudouridine synthase [Nitrospirae bacterium CG_4_10_14_3_um_filter_53_41]PJA75156.1 MAG: RNA pseudouridi